MLLAAWHPVDAGDRAVLPAAEPDCRRARIAAVVLGPDRLRASDARSRPKAPCRADISSTFYPGTLALIVLFTAIFSTISVIEDRQEGFLQGVLVAPVPRVAIVLGKILGSATLALMQAALFLLLAPLTYGGLGAATIAALLGDPGGDRVRPLGARVPHRLAARFDAGLPRDHEPVPGADVDAVGGVVPGQRRHRVDPVADVDQPAHVRRVSARGARSTATCSR